MTKKTKMLADGTIIDLEKILEPLYPYKEYFSSVKKYDEISKQKGLPSSRTLIRHFGTWNEVKREMGYEIRDHSQEVLCQIAKKHANYFTTVRTWNAYAKSNGFPSAQAYIESFGSWNQAKEKIGFEESYRTSPYTVDQIIQVAKKYSDYLSTKEKWNQLSSQVKNEDIPRYETIINQIDWYELKNIVLGGNYKRRKYTEEELKRVLEDHAEEVKTRRHWETYVKENDLPNMSHFYRAFGSWNVCKEIAKDFIKSRDS